MNLPPAVLALADALEPLAQEALIRTIHNLATHHNPVEAARAAAVVTASRASAIEIANAIIRSRRKAKRP